MTTTKTTNQGEGSMLYSAFSLRPPLPNINDYDMTSTTSTTTTTTHQQHSMLTTTQKISESDNIDNRSQQKRHSRMLQQYFGAIKSSFIFRMYFACHILRVTTETRFTAVVLLHRFIQAKNKARFQPDYDDGEEENNNNNEDGGDLSWIGAVCLFLACKTEEEPRRLRDVINMARMVLSENSDDDMLTLNLSQPPSLNEEAYWDSKKKAIETEQMVLRWLGFDCSVSHPHRAVYWILENEIEVWRLSIQTKETKQTTSNICKPKILLNENNLRVPIPIPKKKRKYDNATHVDKHGETIQDKFLSSAFQRLNDTLFYPTALKWDVVELACAALDLAADELEEDDEDDDAIYDDTLVIRNKKTDDNNNGRIGSKSIFKKGWWKRYEVSNEAFNGCKNSLMEATSYLKTVTTSTITASTTTQVRK
eukprot:CAMPEP_0170868624 /NCGR_PEP_ID=MMETSP0734-20130129/23716_1 /TAXON_ID=186038 /ORGANISM="Fragilariopsis kerguelensis, Strain L26-C5" /LENGTH=421 /DNA_ID=CAMNT_0011246523 /DNA_START=18 /DNA_END=1283 /DNA_ORIENTATION=-